MRRCTLTLFTLLFAWAALPLRADLTAAKAEPKLEKRARLALDNAEAALKSALAAYNERNDLKQTNASLTELRESVELACDALRQTGKNPSKSPRHFKDAEIRTRELLRRLNDFREQTSVMDRDELDKVIAGVQESHDELLAGIMGGKKKK